MSSVAQGMEGVVLRITDYGESDQIVGFLTAENGKMSAFAPGAKKSQKRFGRALDFFAHVRLFITPSQNRQSSLARLQSVDLICPHDGIRKSLKNMAEASYLTECLWIFAMEGDAQPAVYSWWLQTLNRFSNDPLAYLETPWIESELLSLTGYRPQWITCFECGLPPNQKDEELFFSFDRGGVCCKSCRHGGSGAWFHKSWIDLFLSRKPLPEESHLSFRRAMDGLLRHSLGRELKSHAFREEMFQ